MLPAGPTKPERSLGEGQDKACIPVLQAGVFGSGLTTQNCKKDTVTKTKNDFVKLSSDSDTEVLFIIYF